MVKMVISSGKIWEKNLKVGAKIEFSKVPKCEQFGFLEAKLEFRKTRGRFKILNSDLNGSLGA